jgi:hypothetical protein
MRSLWPVAGANGGHPGRRPRRDSQYSCPDRILASLHLLDLPAEHAAEQGNALVARGESLSGAIEYGLRNGVREAEPNGASYLVS